MPDEIKTIVKDIGNDCYECVKKWTQDNWNQPIENPIENYIQYGNKPDEIRYLDNQGYFDILNKMRYLVNTKFLQV